MVRMLATSFNRRAAVIEARHGFLSEDQMRAIVPSIFAEEAHDSRSHRYTYIPTIKVVQGLAREGFLPTFACQAKPRDESKFEHTKHMLRFRRERDAGSAEAKELIMVNSHDGTTSYQLLAGVFRFVCKNGLICGDKFAEVRVQHKGDIVDDVIEGAYQVVEDFASLESDIAEMKAIEIKPAESLIMAETAAEFRFEIEDHRDSPVAPSRFLMPRRAEDNARDLWSTFNRIQENAIRGGLHGESRDANGRRRRTTTREVRGIDQNVNLNRMLWRMAQLMADAKTGRAAPEMVNA